MLNTMKKIVNLLMIFMFNCRSKYAIRNHHANKTLNKHTPELNILANQKKGQSWPPCQYNNTLKFFI